MYAIPTGSTGTVERYAPNLQSGPCVSGVVAVAVSLLLVGTGASYPVNAYRQWRQYVQPRTQFAFGSIASAYAPATSPEVDVRNVAQHLANIRGVLSPSMSELAKNLGITRQALYKWLSGENQPDDASKLQFITNLSNVADSFSKAGLNDAKLLVKMKAFNGKSLVDLIKEGADWHKPVQVLIDEAKTMNAVAYSANYVASKARPTDDWKSSVSIPGTVEE
ncbi:XRE family transcriptional regulator [Salmonella enterica]|nr:XRE family transcriptional regulator [Salmonella enterica]EAU2296914.1 XRE family transcriptional regulator [Salmonella enterica]EBD6168978.1 helix-turn-helix transcriptional regulator [Salmonella enterica]EBI9053751.1 XRE family transcriptional regulator [Salmonella enterica]EDC2355070.1 helix-turn-helix transcriptional regulator [Salmonella enterica]